MLYKIEQGVAPAPASVRLREQEELVRLREQKELVRLREVERVRKLAAEKATVEQVRLREPEELVVMSLGLLAFVVVYAFWSAANEFKISWWV